MLKFFPSIVLKILGSNLKSSIKLYSIFGRKVCLLRPKVLNLCYRIILVAIFLVYCDQPKHAAEYRAEYIPAHP